MAQDTAFPLQERLMASIGGDALVVICGAGLSAAPPSSLPSAWQVAQDCAVRYRQITGSILPDGLADNIELLAQYFYKSNQLEHVLLKQLIDWGTFIRRPFNQGHLVIADFLAAHVCALALSTNLDSLIESAASSLGEPDFYPLVFENDLNLNHPHAPLLKIHGCAVRSRHESLWCKDQLQREPLKSRLPLLTSWMQHYLPNRDLLVVGFWTDWSYLNKLFEDAIVSTEPRSVIVVDPAPSEALEAKSPGLWKWANDQTNFVHVQCSGDAFLEELRTHVSRHHIWRAWEKGRVIYQNVVGREPAADPIAMLTPLSADELYQLRRDLTGVTAASIVREKDADDAKALLGVIQLALLAEGATLSAHFFEWAGKTIRLIHAPGRPLSAVREAFAVEPPDPAPPNRTVCVGALDDGGVPAHIIGRGSPQEIIRTSPPESWETHDELLCEIRLAGAK